MSVRFFSMKSYLAVATSGLILLNQFNGKHTCTISKWAKCPKESMSLCLYCFSCPCQSLAVHLICLSWIRNSCVTCSQGHISCQLYFLDGLNMAAIISFAQCPSYLCYFFSIIEQNVVKTFGGSRNTSSCLMLQKPG